MWKRGTADDVGWGFFFLRNGLEQPSRSREQGVEERLRTTDGTDRTDDMDAMGGGEPEYGLNGEAEQGWIAVGAWGGWRSAMKGMALGFKCALQAVAAREG